MDEKYERREGLNKMEIDQFDKTKRQIANLGSKIDEVEKVISGHENSSFLKLSGQFEDQTTHILEKVLEAMREHGEKLIHAHDEGHDWLLYGLLTVSILLFLTAMRKYKVAMKNY